MSLSLQGFPEGKIDFVGQQRVEFISRIWLFSSAVISFLLGFALQSLQITFGLFTASTLLLALAVIPPWPLFNQHPVQWLSVRPPLKKD